MKGDIQGAIEFFFRVVEEPDDLAAYPLIEAYANLGSIYNEHVRDYERALDMYAKGLAAPRSVMVDEDVYDLTVSRVYEDIAIVYLNLQDFPRAKEYSLKCLAGPANLDKRTKARVHLRLGRILLEMAEHADALTHAKMGVESFDSSKNSKEYSVVAFSSLYGGCFFRRYFELAEPFPDLEDIVSRLQNLHTSNPEDAETLFLLVPSLLCLALCEYYWLDVSQRKSIISRFLVCREAYATLSDSGERAGLLSKMSVDLLSEKTGVVFDLAMFEDFFRGLGFRVGAAGRFETDRPRTSFSPRIPPTRATELKPPVNIARLKATALRALQSLSDDRQKASTPDDAVVDGDASERGSPLPDSSDAGQHDAPTAFSRLAKAAISERDPSRRKQAQEDLIAAYPGGRAGLEQSVSTLVGGLTDPDRSAIAVLALRGWGDMAVPYLNPVLSSDNRELRQAVVKVLILIGEFNRLRDRS